jgi:hypothetical protein
MIYGIFNEQGARTGSVMKIMGEPPKTRWWAFASGDRKAGFPTKKQAVEWLLETGRADKETAK